MVALWMMLCLPWAAWFERRLRPNAVLWLRDCLFEALNLLAGSLPLIVFVNVLWLLGLLGLWLLWLWHKGVRDLHDERVRRLGRRVGRFALWLAGLVGFSTYWFFGAWQPAAGAMLSTAGLIVYFAWFRKSSRRRRALVLSLGLVAAAGTVIFVQLDRRGAEPLPQTRFFAGAAYEAAVLPNGDAVVLAVDRGSAMVREPGGWRDVPLSQGPQRLVVEPSSGQVYISNFSARWRGAIMRLGGERRLFALPPCSKTIDVAAAPPDWILAACEFSGTLHVFNWRHQRSEGYAHVPRLPYSIAVDGQNRRAYVASEILSGFVTKTDYPGLRLLARRLLGMVNWGAAFDPRTGRLFVARPLSGELAVLDGDLNLVARVPVGAAPRDLLLDLERGRVLAGNYFSGVVTAVDTQTLQVTGRWRIGGPAPWHRLRGLNQTADGD
jgi:hypothetical protein